MPYYNIWGGGGWPAGSRHDDVDLDFVCTPCRSPAISGLAGYVSTMSTMLWRRNL
jgi:hypothetical protein